MYCLVSRYTVFGLPNGVLTRIYHHVVGRKPEVHGSSTRLRIEKLALRGDLPDRGRNDLHFRGHFLEPVSPASPDAVEAAVAGSGDDFGD
jgi:hypothetical protein